MGKPKQQFWMIVGKRNLSSKFRLTQRLSDIPPSYVAVLGSFLR
jgi:hypothetical protein